MKRINILILPVLALSLFAFCASVFAVDNQLLKARIIDIDGRPMEGAKLFLYDSSNVRRPADFISPVSDPAGNIQTVLPPGNYWVVARHKSDGKYGPLRPGDKHSGEPLEVDLTTSEVKVDFVVADIQELGQKKRANATDSIRVKGRVIDNKGAPVINAFVFADRTKEFKELPDYISAWTDKNGEYELYLPPGSTYYAGASQQFPPRYQEVTLKKIVAGNGKIDIAIDIDLAVQ